MISEDKVVIEYTHSEDGAGYWINVVVDRKPYTRLGPFASAAERQRAQDDALSISRTYGAVDLPLYSQ